jgi:hypothetical protein
MISAYEFFQTSGKQLTFSKLIEILKLPPPQREEFIENNKVEDMSVRELREEVEAQLPEKEEVQQKIIDISKPMNVSDSVAILDKALAYMSEELDNVFIQIDKLTSETYKKEYSGNKDYFKYAYKNIDTNLSLVSKKLIRAKLLLKKLRKWR